MCAAMEAAEKPMDHAAGKPDNEDIVTIWSEAAILFKDSGERNDFAPGPATRCMPGLREQKKNREFCDVVLRALDGSDIWAHRFVMAARYSGCHALFALAKEGMSPEEKWLPPMRLVVEDLGSDLLQLLVDVAYHIPLHDLLSPHNVVDVLDLANKLELSHLRNHCVKIFVRNLKPETCIGSYRLACSRGYDHLAREALRYLVRNFDQVWKKNTEFETLTPEDIRAMLEDDRLHAPNEVEDTFNALLKWIHADVAVRKGYLAKFLPLLRLAWCSVSDFEKVITNPDVQSDEDCVKVLSVIHQSTTRKSMVVREVAGMDLSHRMWMRPRIPKGIIFAFGGWTEDAIGGWTEDAIGNMLTYNCRTQMWREIGNQCPLRRGYHGMAVIDHRIYIVGGHNGHECCNTLACFDVALGRWSSKANMGRARSAVSVAVLKGYIYAMGGTDGIERTRTVERYCVENNQWTNVAAMNYVRSAASAAAACERIYIAGGLTSQEILDSVECYDPSTNVWTVVKPMPWRSSGHKLVAHDGIIYIIGGFDGTTSVAFMTQYDVRRDRYCNLPSMPYANSYFAAVVLEGSIYAIGGYTGMNSGQQVQRYDIAAERWCTAPLISTKCYCSAACVVQNVTNHAAWT